MDITFKQEVDDLIKRSREVYQLNPSRIFSDYRHELDLIKEYDGRQILELLQNADDAGSGKVLIELDTTSNLLLISNTGEPFSIGGVQSLMLANSSPKTKKIYIGNKGLGFRSILNWSEQVDILSNGCRLSFSIDNARHQLSKLEIPAEALRNLMEARNYAEGAVPFAVLAIPDVEEEPPHSDAWVTTVRIKYDKAYEADIVAQLSAFREESLLFLHHLTDLTITGLAEGPRYFHKQGEEAVQINDRSWTVIHEDEALPEHLQDNNYKDTAYYGLKIAFNTELSDDVYQLFTFFPTNVPIRLPCVIHGTFELDNSRKYLNDSDRNKYILERLAKLLISLAGQMAESEPGWQPYRLVTPVNATTDHKLIEQFYQILQQAKEKASIYPTLGKTCRSLPTIRFYGNTFSALIAEANAPGFEDLLVPVPAEISIKPLFNTRPYHNSQIKPLIEQLSRSLNDDDRRARLLYTLYYDLRSTHNGVQYAVLTNDQQTVIPLANVAFTPILSDRSELAKPDFVKIDLMSFTLYERLALLMGTPDRPMPPREVQSRIKEITNLQPYDPVEVTERIISGTLEHIQYQATEFKVAAIREMVKALWTNYNHTSRSTNLNREVPLLSRNGYSADSRSLFLGKSYPSGILTEEIFGDIYGGSEYLLDATEWGFLPDAADPIALKSSEDFFLWLGVNKLTRLEPVNKEGNTWEPYFSYLKEQVPAIKNFHQFKIAGTAINGYARISRSISREALLLWILKCDKLKAALEKNNTDRTEYQDAWKKWYVINDKPSFIQYQLKAIHQFDQYVIEDYNIPVINTVRINYEHPLFLKYGLTRPDIDSILLKLGAKENFNQLDEKRVFDIINSLRPNDPAGQYTQKLYRIALEWLDGHDVHYRPYLYLFAKKNGVGRYDYPAPIYYSDNQALPKRIMDDFPILNLPKRAGEDKAGKLFGIRVFKEINLEIEQKSLKPHPLEKDFLQRWEQMKPLILAHRLDKLNLDSVKREAVATLRNCEIHLVAACTYQFGDRTITMEKNELINTGNRYYLMALPECTDLNVLRKDSAFCDAFAEILCIQFKINELKNVFRNLLINEIEDSRHVIENDLNEGLFQEVKKWLGLSTPLQQFWKAIFKLKDRELPEQLADGMSVVTLANETFGFDFSPADEKVTMDGWNAANASYLKNVLETLQMPAESYFKETKEANGLLYYHLKNTENAVYDLENTFKSAYWSKLQSGTIADKETFLSGLHEYRQRIRTALLDKLRGLRFVFEPGLEPVVRQTIEEQYQLKLTDVDERFLPVNQYTGLLHSFEKSPDDLPVNLRSLLYFSGCETQLREALAALQPELPEETQPAPDTADIEVSEVNDDGMSAVTPATSTAGQSGKRPWVAHPRKLQAQQDIGLASEKLVKSYLEGAFGEVNVKWRSGYSDAPDRDDNLQYDIQYKNHLGVWKYVEVKTLGAFGFTISQPEVDKGLAEPDNYELFLVRGNHIFIVRDFFKFGEGESFESNDRYHVSPKDYQISFQITSKLKADSTVVLTGDVFENMAE